EQRVVGARGRLGDGHRCGVREAVGRADDEGLEGVLGVQAGAGARRRGRGLLALGEVGGPGVADADHRSLVALAVRAVGAGLVLARLLAQRQSGLRGFGGEQRLLTGRGVVAARRGRQLGPDVPGVLRLVAVALLRVAPLCVALLAVALLRVGLVVAGVRVARLGVGLLGVPLLGIGGVAEAAGGHAERRGREIRGRILGLGRVGGCGLVFARRRVVVGARVVLAEGVAGREGTRLGEIGIRGLGAAAVVRLRFGRARRLLTRIPARGSGRARFGPAGHPRVAGAGGGAVGGGRDGC